MKRALPILIISVLLLAGCSEEGDDDNDVQVILIEDDDDREPEDNTTQDDALQIDLFIVVHCEPGNLPQTTEYPDRYWPALELAVRNADEFGMRLNILMNPQWATYIMDDPERRILVRKWCDSGHEIGLHHHGPHAGSWNGYTDQEEFASNPKYIGDMEDCMDLMMQVPKSGKIRVAGVQDQDAELDYPGGISYDVDGGAGGTDDLVSVPDEVTWNGHTMTHLSHGKYGGGSEIDLTIPEIETAMDDMEEGEVMGLVFHAFEFDSNPDDIVNLFRVLNDRGVHSRSVPDIINGLGQ